MSVTLHRSLSHTVTVTVTHWAYFIHVFGSGSRMWYCVTEMWRFPPKRSVEKDWLCSLLLLNAEHNGGEELAKCHLRRTQTHTHTGLVFCEHHFLTCTYLTSKSESKTHTFTWAERTVACVGLLLASKLKMVWFKFDWCANNKKMLLLPVCYLLTILVWCY